MFSDDQFIVWICWSIYCTILLTKEVLETHLQFQ